MNNLKCGKCHGTGCLDSLKHIDNGKCFECGGTGRFVFTQRARQAIQSADESIRRKAMWMIHATTEDIQRMSWEQLKAAREFCMSAVPVGPSLRDIWNRIGEDVFETAHSEVVSDWKANGGW